MNKQLLKRLTIPVQQLPCISSDGYGVKTFDTPIDLLCYRIGKVTVIRTLDGEEVVSNQTLLFDGILAINIRDEFILGSNQYPLLGFNPITGVLQDPGITEVYI